MVLPPNRNALATIRDKVQYWNNYAGTIGYTAAGTMIDYVFKELGAAASPSSLGLHSTRTALPLRITLTQSIRNP
jgi:hypothetical protein